MRNRFFRLAVAALLPFLMAGPAGALEAVDAYARRSVPGDVVRPLGEDLFGDRVNFYNGVTTFAVTDVSLPGNSTLPVAIRRTHTAGAKGGRFGDMVEGPPAPGLFGEWDLDIPHLHGMFSMLHGWQVVGGDPNARCSAPNSSATIRPPDMPYFYGDAYWSGHFLSVPGQGDQRMLLATTPASVRPQGSTAFRWNTSGQWYFSCTPLKNGGGDAFIGHAPDGTRYYFDWLVYQRNAPILKWNVRATVERTIGFLYPTRVEDRFGNWVKYTWSGTALPLAGHALNAIEASDGRKLTLSYVNAGSGLSASQKISAVSDGTRTWRYQYTAAGFLQKVTLPDGSAWTLQTAVPNFETTDGGATPNPTACTRRYIYEPHLANLMAYRMTHPSGAVGEFVFQPTEHGRARVFPGCHWDASRQEDANRSAKPYFFVMSLIGKTISGLGMEPRAWHLAYSGHPGSWADCTNCNTIKHVEVTDNAGHFARYYFSMHFGHSEGRLLEQHEGGGHQILRKTWHYFDTAEDSPSPAYARVLGHAGDYWGKAPTDVMQFPQRGVDLLQDGVLFSWRVENGCNGTLCFDVFARPLSVRRFNSLGHGKTDATAYYDDRTQWVLGQVLRSITSGTETRRTTFDAATALPTHTFAFGKLQDTLAYHADGTLASIRDGNDNVTTYSNWKRGRPQLVRHPATPEAPAGATESSVVNDDGTVASVTNAVGHKTCFEHDAMGRLSKVIHPSETQPGVCDTSAWTPTTITFNAGHASAYGVPGGHWRQTMHTGNGRHVVVFDALWRPVVEQWLDLGDVGATMREVIKRYDASGRLAFESYPMNTGGQAHYASPSLKGVQTFYDALGRVTRVDEDSELGRLATTTEYLTGGQTRVTNPRGKTTTTTYQMFDVPNFDLPVRVEQPESVVTEITRDVFGKPTSVTRMGAGP